MDETNVGKINWSLSANARPIVDRFSIYPKTTMADNSSVYFVLSFRRLKVKNFQSIFVNRREIEHQRFDIMFRVHDEAKNSREAPCNVAGSFSRLMSTSK